jgi:hypothetical protein
MSGNLASPCHSPMTVFATGCTHSGKTQANQEVCTVLRKKLELASSLLNRLQHTSTPKGLEK